jgi:xanthosine utilization system XapX-like protein
VDDEEAGGRKDPVPGVWFAPGVVCALVVLAALHPLLVNLHGPFGEHALLGLLAALAVAVVVGIAVGLVSARMARRSVWALVGLVSGLVALAVVAFPTRIDAHESFVEQPNERSSCRGLEFLHYPPNTSDANDDVYCVGLESPLTEG